jgi:hypothetical protein
MKIIEAIKKQIKKSSEVSWYHVGLCDFTYMYPVEKLKLWLIFDYVFQELDGKMTNPLVFKKRKKFFRFEKYEKETKEYTNRNFHISIHEYIGEITPLSATEQNFRYRSGEGCINTTIRLEGLIKNPLQRIKEIFNRYLYIEFPVFSGQEIENLNDLITICETSNTYEKLFYELQEKGYITYFTKYDEFLKILTRLQVLQHVKQELKKAGFNEGTDYYITYHLLAGEVICTGLPALAEKLEKEYSLIKATPLLSKDGLYHCFIPFIRKN